MNWNYTGNKWEFHPFSKIVRIIQKFSKIQWEKVNNIKQMRYNLYDNIKICSIWVKNGNIKGE